MITPRAPLLFSLFRHSVPNTRCSYFRNHVDLQNFYSQYLRSFVSSSRSEEHGEITTSPGETLIPMEGVHTIVNSENLSNYSAQNTAKEDFSGKKNWTGTIDTQALIDALSLQFTTAQAEALVVVMQDIVREKLSTGVISKQQIDTDSQMLKARCHEIRLDLQIQQSKNATARKALHERCTNEIQSTIEKLRDGVDMLQSDARMRLSLFKSENREELSKIDSSVHHENSQLALQISDIKTFMEGVKVRLMFKFTIFLIFALLALVLEKNIKKSRLDTPSKRPSVESSNGSSQPDVLPTTDELLL
ncbi:hypothetical protein MDAP_000053 [Mitosporidium daphniae]|uniref:DUF1640 domain-containing protein n=1 Tax=Mitosporidium daphniae TaxID=1485682 RepID=A0A098VUI4_9MICR|nr:uncharacterized protein DI09_14p200 [Mitosporidium daphniae]KGG52637.1 hypothetical protein DI09_14p200 [Mitosporidium daphniae]|eukprot:XP_013239064.1 uncharacterized protein DI09_14p200 [Mitosporidium daphniae]